MRSPLVLLLLLLLSPLLLLPAQAKPTPSLTTTIPSTHPPTPTYNSSLAKALADYCAAAYACGSFQGCRHWKCTSCLEHPNTEIIRFSGVNTSTSGFVGYDPDLGKVIIAFAGTQPGVDGVVTWMNNLQGELIDYPCDNCQVHSGFWLDYQELAAELKLSLGYVLGRFPTAPILITGHSLGGALATLAAADLHTNHSIVMESIYTFGTPRVGNQPFAMFYTEVLTHTHTHNWRVVHAQDPVPHVPPVLLGFWHPPREIFYDEGQESWRECDSTGEDYTCSNQFLFQYNVADHQNYLGVPF